MNQHQSRLAAICARLLSGFSSLLTGVHSLWAQPATDTATVYFGNHTSHGDFVLIWTALPADIRERARPVAGSDYWLTSKLRRFIGRQVFNALLIDRNNAAQDQPIERMVAALDAGSSLILFPEGTRNTGDELLLGFKSGLFRICQQRPQTRLVPVWIDNINRVLPKGHFVPVPLLCRVSFGPELFCLPDETKVAFLQRARLALLALAPEDNE